MDRQAREVELWVGRGERLGERCKRFIAHVRELKAFLHQSVVDAQHPPRVHPAPRKDALPGG